MGTDVEGKEWVSGTVGSLEEEDAEVSNRDCGTSSSSPIAGAAAV